MQTMTNNTTRELNVGGDDQALRLMGAEIMFYDNSSAMRRALTVLMACGFGVHLFDWRDPCGTDTRWLLAWVQTPLDASEFKQHVIDLVSPDGEFLHWLSALVKPYDGYVHETGYADPPGPNSMRPTDH